MSILILMKSLYLSTLEKLRADPRTDGEIAEGANVNLHWLKKFKQGAFENPGVNTVEKLHNFLKQKRRVRSEHRPAA